VSYSQGTPEGVVTLGLVILGGYLVNVVRMKQQQEAFISENGMLQM